MVPKGTPHASGCLSSHLHTRGENCKIIFKSHIVQDKMQILFAIKVDTTRGCV